jgi:hypothetical protein
VSVAWWRKVATDAMSAIENNASARRREPHHDTAITTRVDRNSSVNSIFFSIAVDHKYDLADLQSYLISDELRYCTVCRCVRNLRDPASALFQAGRLLDRVGVSQPDRVIHLEAQQNTSQRGRSVGRADDKGVDSDDDRRCLSRRVGPSLAGQL